MQKKICYNCFKEITDQSGRCSHCGYQLGQNKDNYSFALPEGTVLKGRYIVGRVLEYGGFGITYIAQAYWNKALVAVKEYYPENMAVRTEGCTVSAYSAQRAEDFAYGRDCFLEEARTLKELNENSYSVCVHDYFEQNGTAYFVMDYMEGMSFQKYLKDRGRAISWEETKRMILPVMEMLSAVHAKGIIPRDVSPENIFIARDGSARLLELGAARYSFGDRSCSLDVVLNHGFAPKEQYTRHGRQGAYSVVYSLAATMYYAITFRIPPASIYRFEKDELIKPSNLGVLIPPQEENVLLRALAVQDSDRYRTVTAFQRALKKASEETAVQNTVEEAAFETLDWDNDEMHTRVLDVNDLSTHVQSDADDEKQKLPKSDNWKENRKNRKKWLIPVATAAVVVAILASAFFGRNKLDRGIYEAYSSEKSETISVSEMSVEPVNTTCNVMAVMENTLDTDYDKRGVQYFWGQTDYQRKDVKKISFQSTLDGVPQNAWDVSEDKDGSVMAWMNGRNLLVAAEGKIAPNPDASNLFSFFVNLTRIDFGDCFDTVNVTDTHSMFKGCSSLTNLDVSGFSTANVTDMSGMFFGCSSLTSLDVSNFSTENVTDMHSMFKGCSSLTSLDVNSLVTTNVTDMSGMFESCSSLISLDVGSFATENVIYMGSMFFGCSSLTSLDVSNFDTVNVTHMGCMFNSCRSLTSLDMREFDTANVTDMSWMFFGCDQLSQLNTTDERILSEYKKR